MAVEITMAPRRMFFQPISWAAIFAALAVGIAVQMLLMLAGLALGVSVVEPVDASAREVSLSATGWSTASMIIAAFVGGYVASRASGLRRKGDGALHGAVAWAASTLLYAVLASTVLGQASAGVFGAMRPLLISAIPGQTASTQSEQARAEAIRSLESAGLSTQQAVNIVDQMSAATGSSQASSSAQINAEQAADRVGLAIGWLSAAVLLSLLAGVVGGLTGTAGQRRVNRRTDVSYGEARVLSRTPL